MAILVNIGKRGFVLKEGMLNPGSTITVDQETAEKLSRAYPKELKVIIPDVVVKQAPVKEPEVQQCEGPVAEAPKEEPKKRGRKPKAK